MLGFDRIAELELAALGSWPADELRDLDGWKLRFTGGVTRRGNSVWTSSAQLGIERASTTTVDERILAVERFYRERAQPALFQLSPISEPPELDRLLEARGYEIDSPVSIQLADAASVAALERPRGVTTEVRDTLTDEWFETSGRRGRFQATTEIYRNLLERLASRALFAHARLDSTSGRAATAGAPAAVGFAVVDGHCAGIFSMLTLPDARRRGLGRAILIALAEAATDRQSRELYLQVERSNPAGLALYAQCGFREAYGYHYRKRAIPGGDAQL